MESIISTKVQAYLIEYIGERTAPGVPVFDAALNQWRVPVLCKLPNGQLPVGEFMLDEEANFVSIPDKDAMIRVADAYVERVPYLVYGSKDELARKGIDPVAV